ncbi:Hypothetical predicted protein [Mytilus galloprovincialis]|uniref:Ig-like domain-containing protein n=1 Tax=Mytilus galloprovincialis TaxID=29158 RepID=A0A8B6C1G6_MYTGA|nr:Hypothetical predicted protein [Mytilus galloprovincialis]
MLIFILVKERKCFNRLELVILPNDNTIVGTNGSTFTVTCSINNTIPGTKNISWIKNGKIVNSSTSNKLSLTFSLTKEIDQQNLTCKAVIGCIDMPIERVVRFNVTCKYVKAL